MKCMPDLVQPVSKPPRIRDKLPERNPPGKTPKVKIKPGATSVSDEVGKHKPEPEGIILDVYA